MYMIFCRQSNACDRRIVPLFSEKTSNMVCSDSEAREEQLQMQP